MEHQASTHTCRRLLRRPHVGLSCLLMIQFIIYMDRGILPGCNSDISLFVSRSINTRHPDAFVGLLQSGFVVGLCISCPFFAHFSMSKQPRLLICIGLIIWTLAAVLCSVANRLQAFTLLLFGRTLSGVGEAAIICLAPTLILNHENQNATNAGLWMSALCAFIPLGTAAGYCWGSLWITLTSYGWFFAFLTEAFFGTLLTIAAFIFLKEVSPNSTPLDLSNVTQYEHDPFQHIQNNALQKQSQTISVFSHIPTAVSPDSSPVYSECADKRASTLQDSKPLLEAQLATEDHAPQPQSTSVDQAVRQEQIDTSFHSFFATARSVIFHTPAFAWFTLASAGYAFTTAALSVFGAAFLLDLGLVSSSGMAGPLMGLTIAVSGFTGATVGGYAVAYASVAVPSFQNSGVRSTLFATRPQHRPHFTASPQMREELQSMSSSHGPTREPLQYTALSYKDQDNVIPAKQQDSHRNKPPLDHTFTSTGLAHSEALLAPLAPTFVSTGFEYARHESLRNTLRCLAVLLCIGISCLLFSSVFARQLWQFVIGFGCGLTTVFAAQAGLSIAIMQSVPEAHQPTAIALNTVILHIGGDVPSPLLAGYLKDCLAPACAEHTLFSVNMFSLDNFDTPFSGFRTRHRILRTNSTLFFNGDPVDAARTAMSIACREEEPWVRFTIALLTVGLWGMVAGLMQGQQALRPKVPL